MPAHLNGSCHGHCPLLHASWGRTGFQGRRREGRREGRRRQSGSRRGPHVHCQSGPTDIAGRWEMHIFPLSTTLRIPQRSSAESTRPGASGRMAAATMIDHRQAAGEPCKLLCAHGLPPTVDRIAHIGSAGCLSGEIQNRTRALLRTLSSFLRRGLFTIQSLDDRLSGPEGDCRWLNSSDVQSPR